MEDVIQLKVEILPTQIENIRVEPLQKVSTISEILE